MSEEEQALAIGRMVMEMAEARRRRSLLEHELEKLEAKIRELDQKLKDAGVA